MISRPLRTGDWPRVDWLASNEVQEGDHTTFGTEWGQNRREFTRENAHSVVEVDGIVVAYSSIECEADKGWRAFIVLDWSKQDDEAQEAAYNALEGLIAERLATSVWMRELADDHALLKFIEQKGFEVERRYEFSGFEMVNLRKSYAA